MKKLFFAAVLPGILALPAAPVIDKLDYSETVRAGEEFRLTAAASAPGDVPVSITFNGETHVVPPGFHSYVAGEFAAKYSKTGPDGAVTAASNYHTLLSLPFPQDGRNYTVWVRAAGGNLCLRRPEKELKWNFSKSETFRWICYGSWNAETVGPKLALMAEKPPYAQVSRIILTTAPANAYKPSGDGADPNRFVWTPGVSAVGSHRFEVTVSAAGESVKRTIEVTVLPPEKESAAPVPAAVAPGAQRPVDLAECSINPADCPMFDFFGKEFRNMLEEKPFGLAFQPGGMVALRCNAYSALPDTVEIGVHARAAGLALLLTEYWQGEVMQEMAHIRVRYSDGSEARISLREEFELCGSLRNREPQAALYAGTFTSGQAEFHATILPWMNPHPEKEIASLVFSNVRMVVSPEENKLIPLNVTAESSQLLLGALLLEDPADAGRLAAVAAEKKRFVRAETVDVTVDFGSPEGEIHPNVFSTNESNVLSSAEPKFDDYLEKMKSVGCRLYRFHSGWSLERVYPEKLKNPQYEELARTIGKLKNANPEWDVMICFNKIPSYVDPKSPEGRALFASLCADLVRELNIVRKFKLRYWEIYNEVYFKKIEEDRSLWKMYNEAAAAMRQVDPSIKIGGYAPCWPSISAIRDFYRHCGEQTDFLSFHKYLTGSVKTPTDYLMAKTASFGEDARAIHKMAAEERPGKPVEIALTEYNINFNWRPHDPRQANQVGAAWFASVLHHLVKADVEIAQTWHSRGGGTFGLFSDNNEPRPAARFFAIANRCIRGRYLKSATSSPDVECLAFRNPEKFGVLLINKSGRETDVKLDLLNAPATTPDPILPSVESIALREGEVKRGMIPEFPPAVTLQPYEVRLLML